MNGYLCFMRSVKFSFFLILFFISSFLCQVYADCPWLAKSNTHSEESFAFAWGNGWRTRIRAMVIRDQGVDAYFNPKIKVCSKGGTGYPEYCHELYNGTSCKKIYGTQGSGAGVSAMVFVDWTGDGTKIGAKVGKGLPWKWAEDITDEEKAEYDRKMQIYGSMPKICACSQKGACMTGFTAIFARWGGQGANIFRPGNMDNVCDTCFQTYVQCAPLPLLPGPPPLCDQLTPSPAVSVRIVPIRHDDNSFINPRIGVMITGLNSRYDFRANLEEDNASISSIPHENEKYYFKAYKKDNKLCANYYGTSEPDNSSKPQFTRCFPAPPIPDPEKVEVESGELKVTIKIKEQDCNSIGGHYQNGRCVFKVSKRGVIDKNGMIVDKQRVGELDLKLIRPKMEKVESNQQSNIISAILEKSDKFKNLKSCNYIPKIQNRCSDNTSNCIVERREFFYEESGSNMLCLSGLKPSTKEFFLKRGNEIYNLKSLGNTYVKYVTAFSRESNRIHYKLCKNQDGVPVTIDLLKNKNQDELDKITFDNTGYLFIPGEGNNLEPLDKDEDIKTKANCSTHRIVYKEVDGIIGEKCQQGADGCKDGTRSTEYVNKTDSKPFFLKYEEIPDPRDAHNKRIICKDDQGREVTCTKLESVIEANRPEVFFADKLCAFDLTKLKEKLTSDIESLLKRMRESIQNSGTKSYTLTNTDNFTGDLSQYDHVIIKAWGGGEAAHPKAIQEKDIERRAGMPGNYVNANFKIDQNYPIIKVKRVGTGGSVSPNGDYYIVNTNGGPTEIEICDKQKSNCKILIRVAGGGQHYEGQQKTKIFERGLVIGSQTFTDIRYANDKNAYITNIDKNAYISSNGVEKYQEGVCNNKLFNSADYSNNSGYMPGAGGCIKGNDHGFGFPGKVIITPIMKKLDSRKIESITSQIVDNPNEILSDSNIDDSIRTLDSDIQIRIKEQICKLIEN